MSYKSILVHAGAGRAAEARVRCAADLADRFGALLIGCGSEAPPAVLRDAFAVAKNGLASAMIDTPGQHLIEAQAMFEAAAGARPRRWVASQIPPDEALAGAARAADLIIANSAAGGPLDPTRQEDPGMLVVISGRPVLVAPLGRDRLDPRRVLVCWKEARESNRAVSDALPFLEQADEVLVVEVVSREEATQAQLRVEDVAAFLGRHGVRATGEALIQDRRQTATTLHDRARAFSADLIVAGGYGRSRLGEWAFGGVTRSLLEQSERFVLLSH